MWPFRTLHAPGQTIKNLRDGYIVGWGIKFGSGGELKLRFLRKIKKNTGDPLGWLLIMPSPVVKINEN